MRATEPIFFSSFTQLFGVEYELMEIIPVQHFPVESSDHQKSTAWQFTVFCSRSLPILFQKKKVIWIGSTISLAFSCNASVYMG